MEHYHSYHHDLPAGTRLLLGFMAIAAALGLSGVVAYEASMLAQADKPKVVVATEEIAKNSLVTPRANKEIWVNGYSFTNGTILKVLERRSGQLFGRLKDQVYVVVTNRSSLGPVWVSIDEVQSTSGADQSQTTTKSP